MINYNPDFILNCWAGFFDLLGMKRMSESDSYIYFDTISKTIEELKYRAKACDNVGYAWFSDSFFVYTNDDSIASFLAIDSTCRHFFYDLIMMEIPVRGAISCGQLYSDIKNNIIFGKALTEAYKYSEAQDWIGFILTPSAKMRLDNLKSPANDLNNYACHNIPYNKESDKLIKKLPACIIGNWDDKDQSVDCLKNMLSKNTENRIKKKYERTLLFIQDHQDLKEGLKT